MRGVRSRGLLSMRSCMFGDGDVCVVGPQAATLAGAASTHHLLRAHPASEVPIGDSRAEIRATAGVALAGTFSEWPLWLRAFWAKVLLEQSFPAGISRRPSGLGFRSVSLFHEPRFFLIFLAAGHAGLLGRIVRCLALDDASPGRH